MKDHVMQSKLHVFYLIMIQTFNYVLNFIITMLLNNHSVKRVSIPAHIACKHYESHAKASDPYRLSLNNSISIFTTLWTRPICFVNTGINLAT